MKDRSLCTKSRWESSPTVCNRSEDLDYLQRNKKKWAMSCIRLDYSSVSSSEKVLSKSLHTNRPSRDDCFRKRLVIKSTVPPTSVGTPLPW